MAYNHHEGRRAKCLLELEVEVGDDGCGSINGSTALGIRRSSTTDSRNAGLRHSNDDCQCEEVVNTG